MEWMDSLMPSGWRTYSAASLTKPIVASQVAKLIDAGSISLDASVASLFPELHGAKNYPEIQVRNLIQHTGGFDRDSSGDPLWDGDQVRPCPVAAQIALSRPLDFVPGQKISYSNVGYCLLGMLVQKSLPQADEALLEALQSPLGAAGGWQSSLPELHSRLKATLPVRDLPPTVVLDDGSYYAYGWRHWPTKDPDLAWTHFGRLPGMLSVAFTDGRSNMLVAYFEGDPRNYNATGLAFSREAWRCLSAWERAR
ncbi:serine hydrolase domain-containing protein [[Pseudomonas] boreopolis]|uniref:serine hydrolase domain-containing protein n=1 Tax=Xanthomonas boreopolis TaxID=86183 RepID=UPI003D450394